MRPGLRRLGGAAILLFAAVIVTVMGCTDATSPAYRSEVVEPPGQMTDFDLVADDGQPFRIADLHGEVAVVYVGYTHCPDICPMTLANLAAARQLLPAEVREHVRVVMITADPARDTPELLSRYVGYFDPTFIGVSGDVDEVLDALHEWGIHPVCDPPAQDGSYAVSHPAISFIFNRSGLLRLKAPHELTPEQLASDLQLVWREGNN
ncbi:MAG: SCO family protein [Dehalococcoidia bacterium]